MTLACLDGEVIPVENATISVTDEGLLRGDGVFEDALLVTPHGRVLEAPTSTLFWVTDGVPITTPLDEHVLDSITRRRVFELMGAKEQAATTDDIEAADEAFIVSSLKEVAPVA